MKKLLSLLLLSLALAACRQEPVNQTTISNHVEQPTNKEQKYIIELLDFSSMTALRQSSDKLAATLSKANKENFYTGLVLYQLENHINIVETLRNSNFLEAAYMSGLMFCKERCINDPAWLPYLKQLKQSLAKKTVADIISTGKIYAAKDDQLELDRKIEKLFEEIFADIDEEMEEKLEKRFLKNNPE